MTIDLTYKYKVFVMAELMPPSDRASFRSLALQVTTVIDAKHPGID